MDPRQMQNIPSIRQTTCSFPAPPVRSVYCEPAAYQQVCGQRYQKMTYAYGKSRPMQATSY